MKMIIQHFSMKIIFKKKVVAVNWVYVVGDVQNFINDSVLQGAYKG